MRIAELNLSASVDLVDDPYAPPKIAAPFEKAVTLLDRGPVRGETGGLTDAIWGFAEHLNCDEQIWFELSLDDAEDRAILARAGVKLQSHHDQVDGEQSQAMFHDFTQALKTSYPRLATTDDRGLAATHFDHSCSVRLGGYPVRVSDLTGGALEERLALGPREVSDPGEIVLGSSGPDGGIDRVVHALLNLNTGLTLRFTLKSRRLNSGELRHLTTTRKSLADLRTHHLLTYQEIERIRAVTSLIGAWLERKKGISLEITVASDEAVDRSTLEAISFALSGSHEVSADPAPLCVDLAGCFVRGQKKPGLLPGFGSTAGLRMVSHSRRSGCRDLNGATIGTSFGGRPLTLDHEARSRHLLLSGATGTGKSNLIATLIEDDLRNGRGVVLIDPHGDLFSEALELVNRRLSTSVWVADTSDTDTPYSLNLFDVSKSNDSYQKSFICNQLIRLLKQSLYKNVPDAFGPLWEAYFRNAVLLLMESGDKNTTLADMDRVFGDARFRRDLLSKCDNPQVTRFWRDIATRAGGEASLENVAPYIVVKMNQFTTNPILKQILCSPTSSIDFSEIFDRGGVCLVNLAKGQIGETESEILGAVFATSIFSAALARSRYAPEERKPIRIYLDEFQSYAGEVVAEMLAECRKYGLELTLATQSLWRLKSINNDLTQSVLGNVANIAAFRSGPYDAELFSEWLGAGITKEDVMQLDDFTAVGRFLNSGRVSQPVKFMTAARKQPLVSTGRPCPNNQ